MWNTEIVVAESIFPLGIQDFVLFEHPRWRQFDRRGQTLDYSVVGSLRPTARLSLDALGSVLPTVRAAKGTRDAMLASRILTEYVDIHRARAMSARQHAI